MSMLTEEEDASSLGSASEDSSASSASLQRLRTRLDELRETRYIQTRSNQSRLGRIVRDPSHLPDDEFKAYFRIARRSFGAIHALIKDDAVFRSSPPARRRQEPSDLQFRVVLLRFGSRAGHGAATIGGISKFCGVGKGELSNPEPANPKVLHLYIQTEFARLS